MRIKNREKMEKITLKHLEEIQKNVNRSRHQLNMSRSKYDMDVWIKQILYQRKSSIINTIEQLEKRISRNKDISSVEQLLQMKKELKQLLISLEDKQQQISDQ